MPNQNPSDIRLNEQADLEAIIGHPPGWTLRWGMTVLLVGITLLLLMGWVVRYPDIVVARTVLTTERPPIRLVAKVGARLDELRVHNGQVVQQGEVLGVLENPARVEDVLLLEEYLSQLSATNVDTLLFVKPPPEGLQLGSLEDAAARFDKSFYELKYLLGQNLNYQQISNLRRQIKETKRLNRSLTRQSRILWDEVTLARQAVNRDSALMIEKSVSYQQFENTKAAWLRKRRELENLKTGLVENNLAIQRMEAQILDLRKQRSDDESNRILTFRSEVLQLQGQIEDWKNTWLLAAPIDGEVALTAAWSAQQYVEAGTEVLTVVPNRGAGLVIGKALLEGEGIGKVETGMTTHLRLDGFPYQEFGTIDGRVVRIASVPGPQGYEALIRLDSGMVTSHGTPIPFRQEMEATARIVTKERNLLTRILESIIKAVEK